MKKIYFSLIVIICTNFFYAQDKISRNDTLIIKELRILPMIDGKYDDQCWQGIEWQPINQVWIPYGTEINNDDFSGMYKVGWSSKTNLLYFIVMITDDVIADGYKYDRDPKKGDFYYNYDMLELFIDEDQSGGLHIFDGSKENQSEFGIKSSNAFAYHLILDFPTDGNISVNPSACDLAGKNWEDYFIADYTNHFPDFILRKNGNEFIYEFSLILFSEDYDENNFMKSRVKLSENKKLGVSIAYCDNDDPNEKPLERDNFIGSVVVPESAYNDHWKNADLFRKAILVP